MEEMKTDGGDEELDSSPVIGVSGVKKNGTK